MIDQAPQVPSTVVQFAEEQGYKTVEPNKFWVATTKSNAYKGYRVYDIKDDGIFFRFILVKGNDIKMATEDESIEISNVYF